jgi:uncharacterized protein (DUF2235 family)
VIDAHARRSDRRRAGAYRIQRQGRASEYRYQWLRIRPTRTIISRAFGRWALKPGGTGMPKNIVVFSDGTGQDGGARPEQRVSNIYKMYRVSRDHADTAIDPSQQVVFYDAGLGTDIGTTAFTGPVRFVQKLLGSVTGAGIKRNIADCYEFIVNHHQPGDRIYLFGFSRGAYTVRSLANLLMLCGIPTKTPAGPLMRFRQAVRDIAWEAVDTVLEHGAGHPRAEFETERLELARRFQTKYGSGDGSDSNAAPYFIGVFDTVAALGASGIRYLVIQAGLSAAFRSQHSSAASFPPSSWRR